MSENQCPLEPDERHLNRKFKRPKILNDSKFGKKERNTQDSLMGFKGLKGPKISIIWGKPQARVVALSHSDYVSLSKGTICYRQRSIFNSWLLYGQQSEDNTRSVLVIPNKSSNISATIINMKTKGEGGLKCSSNMGVWKKVQGGGRGRWPVGESVV